MFEAGDQMGFGLEAAHELGPVGQFGPDHLDRHVTPDRRLGAPVDDSERSLAELFTQAVAPQRRTGGRGEMQRRVAGDDPAVELVQSGTGFQTELLGEAPPMLLVDAGRLRLSAGAVERQHLEPHQAITQRIRVDVAGQAGECVGVHPGREHRVVPTLDGGQPQLVEPGSLRPSPFLAGDVFVGGAAPEGECFVESGESAVDVDAGLRRGRDQLAESHRVDLDVTVVAAASRSAR